MPTLFQKIRLGLRGWSRRREEAARKSREEFLSRQKGWAAPEAVASPVRSAARSSEAIDLAGLQVAWLDDSGQIAYYLDLRSGEVREGRSPSEIRSLDAESFLRRVPQRTEATDRSDREAFAATIEDVRFQRRLAHASASAQAFRQLLSEDRRVERSWYSFKNDRADQAIAVWLASLSA